MRAIRNHTDVTAFVPAENINAYEHEEDVLNRDMRKQTFMGPRIWIVAGRHTVNREYASDTIAYTRRYLVGLGGGSAKVEDIERLEWLLQGPLELLAQLREPNGDPLAAGTSPLEIENLLIGDIDIETLPDDLPSDFAGLKQIEVVAVGPRDLIAIPTTP